MEDHWSFLTVMDKGEKKAVKSDFFSFTLCDALICNDPSIIEKSYRWTQKESERNFLKDLFEESFLNSFYPKLTIDFVHPLVGKGLFADQEIQELTYIGHYAGLLKKRQNRKDRDNLYLFGYQVGQKETPYVIDAEKMGNHTRFLNHSEEPNLRSCSINVGLFSYVLFYTLRKIKKKEQLTYDYGPYFWRKKGAPIDLL